MRRAATSGETYAEVNSTDNQGQLNCAYDKHDEQNKKRLHHVKLLGSILRLWTGVNKYLVPERASDGPRRNLAPTTGSAIAPTAHKPCTDHRQCGSTSVLPFQLLHQIEFRGVSDCHDSHHPCLDRIADDEVGGVGYAAGLIQ